ncbi:MAG: hypothetical protein AAB426_00860 [Myxococcota bacterium]
MTTHHVHAGEARKSSPLAGVDSARRGSQAPSAKGAVAFVTALAKVHIAGLNDGTTSPDALFSVVYPADGSAFARKTDAELAAKAVRAKGYDAYVTKDGLHRYSVVISH